MTSLAHRLGRDNSLLARQLFRQPKAMRRRVYARRVITPEMAMDYLDLSRVVDAAAPLAHAGPQPKDPLRKAIWRIEQLLRRAGAKPAAAAAAAAEVAAGAVSGDAVGDSGEVVEEVLPDADPETLQFISSEVDRHLSELSDAIDGLPTTLPDEEYSEEGASSFPTPPPARPSRSEEDDEDGEEESFLTVPSLQGTPQRGSSEVSLRAEEQAARVLSATDTEKRDWQYGSQSDPTIPASSVLGRWLNWGYSKKFLSRTDRRSRVLIFRGAGHPSRSIDRGEVNSDIREFMSQFDRQGNPVSANVSWFVWPYSADWREGRIAVNRPQSSNGEWNDYF